MTLKKLIAFLEGCVIVWVFCIQIYPHWSNQYTTPGDIATLELIALLSYNIYDKLKKKIS
jgi:hypothetical protein